MRVKPLRLAALLPSPTRLTNLIRQSLLVNAGYLLSVELLNSLVGFIFWGLSARLYTADQVGHASAILSVMTVVAVLAGLDMGTGLIRFLPGSQNPNPLLNSVFLSNALLAILFSVVYLVTVRFWSPQQAALVDHWVYSLVFIACCVVMLLNTHLRLVYLALRDASYSFAQSIVFNFLRLALIFLLAPLGVFGITGAMFLGLAGALVTGVLVFLPRLAAWYRPGLAFDWLSIRVLLPYSMGTYGASLFIQGAQNILPILALEALGPAPAGHARIAWLVGSLIAMPGMALASSAFAEASSSPARARALMARANRTGLGVTLPLAAVTFVATPWILGLFGPGYVKEATPLLRLLALAAPLVNLVNIHFARLRVEKRLRRLFWLNAAIFCLTLGVTSISISRWGLVSYGLGWLAGNLLVVLGTYHPFRSQEDSIAQETARIP